MMNFMRSLLNIQTSLLEQFVQQSNSQVFFGVWNTDMTRFTYVDINMVTAFRTTKYPSIGL